LKQSTTEAAGMVASVFWRDDHELGLKGVVEVDASDFSGGQLEDASICDLTSVLNNKLRVLGYEYGISRKVQRIDMYGSPLSPDQRLNSIIATLPGSSPRLVATMRAHPIKATTMVLRIETTSGASAKVPGAWSETVSCFKLRVRSVLGIAPDDQILVYEETKLDDERTLGSYGIHTGTTINVLLQLNGGNVPPKRFADVSDVSILVARSFAPNAAVWYKACHGLNIEAKCETSSYEAFGQRVIHPVCYEKFNLLLDVSAKCPMCHARVKPITCGFYDCVWKFEGVKLGDGNAVISPWKDASRHQYHRFEADEKSGCVEWASLLIVAKTRRDGSAAKLVASTNVLDPAAARPNDVCTICFSEFGLNSLKSLITAPCSHRFHSNCYLNWSKWCASHASLPSCPAALRASGLCSRRKRFCYSNF
jgi:hypothetical protein